MAKHAKDNLRSREVVKQRERDVFSWTLEFVSVELFKVKKYAKTKKIWKFSKATAKPKVMENLKKSCRKFK